VAAGLPAPSAWFPGCQYRLPDHGRAVRRRRLCRSQTYSNCGRQAGRACACAGRTENKELSWDDVRPVDILGLEVGYRLVPLVNKTQNGIAGSHPRRAPQALAGARLPGSAVHIRDNLDLAPNTYRIQPGGVPVGESIIYPERDMAINPGRVFGQVKGIATRDPAFGMEALWIDTGRPGSRPEHGFTPWSTPER